VLPLLRASGHGRIVNVSSGAGQLSDMGAARRPVGGPLADDGPTGGFFRHGRRLDC
jgi:NAD(P)-dependent dehydrogenase (short-subunit alcohol dehydrogenase family)